MAVVRFHKPAYLPNKCVVLLHDFTNLIHSHYLVLELVVYKLEPQKAFVV